MRGGPVRESRRTGTATTARAARRVALATAFALFLSVAIPPGAVPAGGGFPLGWLWSWLRQAPASASAFLGVPVQPSGKPTPDDHYVSAAATRANGGAGRPSTPTPGALPPDLRQKPEVKRGTTPALAGDHSFDSTRSTRIPSAASAMSDVYTNPDGSFTRRVHEVPVNYRAADGTWKPIDRNLVRGADGRLRQKANSVEMSFAKNAAAAGLVTVGLDASHSLSYTLIGAAGAAPTVTRETATYPGVFPGVDLRLVAHPSGIKESLVLHSADAPTSWLFRLDLKGLTASVEPDLSVVFRDDAGAVRATIPPGYMDDSKFDMATGGFARSLGVTYELTAVDGVPALRVSIDQDWLRDPARVFPVTVDPTTDIGGNPDDTYVLSGTTANRSGESELLVGTYDGGSHKARSFIHVPNFASVYSGSKISAVSLKIFNIWAASCSPKPFWVYKLSQAWSASTTTTYPGPGLLGDIGSVSQNPGAACTNTSGNDLVGVWMTVPLQAATFQSWANGGANYGLGIGAVETDSTQWKRFASKNSTGAWPYLQVTYAPNQVPQVDAQYPPSGYAASTLTPELLVNGHDPDVFPNSYLSYYFIVYDKNAVKIAESGWITSRSWIVPASANLRWGESYLWTVLSGDGYLASSSQTLNVLTTPVPQPLVTSGLSQNGGRGYDPGIGNYTTSAADAAVATVGPALTVHRSYNSLDPRRNSAFGTGWSSLLDTKATVDPSAPNIVAVRYPNGPEVAFGKNPDGTFTPPAGRFASFAAVAGGGYKLVDKDGTTYTFTSAGAASGVWHVTSIADASGRAVTFTYGGAPGLASTVTSASGRALHLTWSTGTTPHVLTVLTDPAVPGNPSTALTWAYTYTGDQLTKVCPPTSSTACTTYTYTNSSLYSNAVLNAGPHSYWRLNEVSGSVANSAVQEHLGTDGGTYANVALGQAGPLAGTASTSAGFNGTSSYVQLPSKLVSSASFKSVSLWFKANPGDNGVLFSYVVEPITSPTATGYVPALYVGVSGKLHGQYWGATNHMVSTGSVADGNWHHATLTAGASTQSLYLDGVLIASTPGAVADFGQRYSYVGAGFQGGGWPDSPFTGGAAQRSYFKGSIGEVSFFDRQLTSGNIQAIQSAATVVARPLNSIVRPSGHASAEISYDGVTGRATQITDQNGAIWRIGAPVASGSSQVYVGAALAPGPADYWRLAESAQGITDAVNQVNGDIATYNAVTLGATGGPFEDATVASFNGTSSYLRLPASDLPSTGPTSISMWFKMPAGNTAGGVLFGYEGTGGWVPAIYVGTDGKLRGHFWVGNGNLVVTTPGAVNDGGWHHVSLAASTNSQSLYLDGARVGNPVNAALVGIGAQNAYVGYGRWDGFWPSHGAGLYGYFPGHVAEVAFYRSQLSAAQVAAQHAARANSTGAPVKTVTVIDPVNSTPKHVYDLVTGRQIAEVDALGNKTQYGYDTGGFLRVVTDPSGNMTTTEHDVRGNTTSSETCQNQSAGACSKVFYTYYPDATTKVLTPDPRNDAMLTMRDARSASHTDNTYLTTNTHDVKGNRTAVTDPLGRVTATAYTDGTTVAAEDGGFAPPGLPATVTTPGGAAQSVVYFHSGDVAKVTDPVGKVTTFTYDGLGRLLTKKETTDTFPAGLTTSYGYDGLGRMVSQTDPPVTNRVTGAVHTAVTTMVHDVDGLVTSQTMADTTGGDASRTVSSTYNTRGQRATSTDATNKTTSFGYDSFGNLVTETAPDGGVTATAFDPDGLHLSTVMAGYTGDPNNPSPPTDLVLEVKAYDPTGRLASVTDAMGWITSYTYTDNGLIAKVTRKDPVLGATFVQEENTYDAAGHLVKQVTNDGATTNTAGYDAAGRVTSSTLDPATLKRTTSHTYSADDYVTSTTQSDAAGPVRIVDASYDPMGRLTARSVRNDAATGPAGWWRLNDTYGTAAADSSGRAQTGSLNGGVSWSDGAAVFNGTTGHVKTVGPVLNTAQSFTVSAWVKPNALTAWGDVLSQEGVHNSAFELQYDPSVNKWAFTVLGSDATNPTPYRARSSVAPSAGTWTHLVGVLDSVSGVATLYVNGAQSGSIASPTPPATSASMVIGRGRYNDANGAYFNGSIDNVQAYSRALSAAEVSGLFGYGRAGGAVGTTALTTSYTVDKGGLVRAVTDPNGHTTDHDYDEAGRLAVTMRPPVQTEIGGGAPITTRPVSYVGYDTFGAQVETKDPNGNVSTTAYDAAGRAVSTTMPGYTPPGSSTPIVATATRTYDGLGQTLTSTDPLGKTTSYVYDQLGRVAKVTAPSLGESKYTYDALGDLLSVTDPTGAVTTATYDYLGRKRTSTQVVRQDSASHTTNYAYAAGGWLSSAQSPTGVNTSMTYNAVGERLTIKDGANNVTAYTYDGAGRAVRTTLPDGTYTAAAYDLAGRQVSMRSHSSSAVLSSIMDKVVELTASGENPPSETATKVADGDVNTKWLALSPSGWLTFKLSVPTVAVRYALTSANDEQPRDPRDWTLQGSADGVAWTTVDTRVNQVFDQRFQTKEYDVANATPYLYYRLDISHVVSSGLLQLAEVKLFGNSTSPAGTVLTEELAAYDANGNVTASTDARGTTTTFAYDATGLLTTEVQPINGSDAITTSFGYDVAGNRTRFTDGRGNAFITTYNTWNLPESRIEPATSAYPAAADRRFTATYDAAGRRAALSSPGGVSVVNTYDSVGNLTQQAGSGTAVTTVDRVFGYDLAGRLTSFSGPGGTNTLAYDDRNLLRSTAGASGTASFTYNSDGAMASRADAAGSTSYGYDGAGRLSTVSNSTAGVQLTTGYNSLSQVSTIVYGTNGNTRSFGYDALHRLIQDELRTSGGTQLAKIAYGYDANDNETSKTTTGFAGAAANSYTYDLADRLTSWNNGTTAVVYAYDKSGNRVQAGSKLFTYDQRNQLLTGDGTSYVYTPRGTLASAGGVATSADAFNQVTSQGVSGGPAQTYSYDALGRVIRAGFSYTGLGNHLASDGAATYARDPSGSLLGEASGTSLRFAWTDLHTDVVGQFTATGTALTGSTTYDPLGKVLATLGMVGNLGYQSEWTDAFTGRVNMLARWYNTDTGQFDTRDTADLSPVPNSVAANRFAYADDNPLTMTDPTGHRSFRDRLRGAGRAIGGAARAVGSAAATAWNAVTSWVSDGWNYVDDALRVGRDWIVDKAKKAVDSVAKTVEQGRKYVAKKVNKVKQHVKQTVKKVKQAGKVVVAKTVKVVQQQYNAVKDAYHAAEKWVQEHKDLLIDIAAIGFGIIAGLACTAATAGAGAVACMVGAAALVNLAKDYAKGDIHNWGDAFGSLGTGALTGLVGGAFGALGGKLVGAAAGKLGSIAAGVGGRFFGGAASGAIGDIGTQAALNRGRIDWGGVGMAAGIGGVSGGFYRGGGPKGGGGRSAEPAAGRRGAEDGAPASCMRHSFDPATRVLMADGSTRPIKDVGVGDKVAATDPKAGTTGAKPVVALHLNRDTDLTDVTLSSRSGGKGATATLKTTQHHPFWDATSGSWVFAAALVVGHQLRAPDGSTETVVAVRNHTGGQNMRDLTVADTHTYYVIAGDTPVLVHNCGTTDLHRVSPLERGRSELDNGLSPEHFPSVGKDGEILTGAAHFGNELRVNDFASSHGGTHGQGFKVTVPNRWLRDSNIDIWEGKVPEQLEYLIPHHLFDEFNQFPRVPWEPGSR